MSFRIQIFRPEFWSERSGGRSEAYIIGWHCLRVSHINPINAGAAIFNPALQQTFELRPNLDSPLASCGPLSRPSTAGYEYFMPPNATVQASQLRPVNDSPHNLDRLGIYPLLMLMISATLLATRHGPQTSLQVVSSRMGSSTTIQLLPPLPRTY